MWRCFCICQLLPERSWSNCRAFIPSGVSGNEHFAVQPTTLCTPSPRQHTPFPGQFRCQCMQFGNSAVNFDGSAFRRPFGHDSACGLSKLVALLPNYMQIVHIWSEKRCICTVSCVSVVIFTPQIPTPPVTPPLTDRPCHTTSGAAAADHFSRLGASEGPRQHHRGRS